MLISTLISNQAIAQTSAPTATQSVDLSKTLKRILKVSVMGYIGLVFGVCAIVGGVVAGAYSLVSSAKS